MSSSTAMGRVLCISLGSHQRFPCSLARRTKNQTTHGQSHGGTGENRQEPWSFNAVQLYKLSANMSCHDNSATKATCMQGQSTQRRTYLRRKRSSSKMQEIIICRLAVMSALCSAREVCQFLMCRLCRGLDLYVIYPLVG